MQELGAEFVLGKSLDRVGVERSFTTGRGGERELEFVLELIVWVSKLGEVPSGLALAV